MRDVATVTSKGQITLPAALRRALNIKPGDKVVFERETNGRVYVETRGGSLADLRGLIKVDKEISAEQLEGWIRQARGRSTASEED